jgi:16S rRNA (guanine966-N2)-methyltransferase
MRIIGGSARGLKLAEVGEGDLAAHLRPTTDRVRESIFNLLINGTHGNPLPGARVLDLFAGTGALGLEALSRGAAQVVFVEDGAPARALIKANVDKMRVADKTEIWRKDATRLGPNTGSKTDAPSAPTFDLVFLDPPYGKALGERALTHAIAEGWLTPGAMVVWEESAPPQVPAPLVQIDQRRYGSTVVTLCRMPV